jgi:hypothetical protein
MVLPTPCMTGVSRVILDGLGNVKVSPRKVERARNILADPEEREQ